MYVHKVVLYDKLGHGPHLCHWCGRPVRWVKGTAGDALIADHVDGDELNNDPGNLVAACNGCNTIRARCGFRPGIAGDEVVEVSKGRRTRGVELECQECGATFVAALARVRAGTAKFCSRRCVGIVSARKRWAS